MKLTIRGGLLAVCIASLALVGSAFAAKKDDAKGASGKPAQSIEDSVVKVFTTVRYPDPYRPWTKQSPQEITGTGVVIEGKRVLTNAHVVMYASQVQIQANQAGDKISATVEYIAPGIDLAILKLEDESFFDTHAAVVRTKKLPNIKDAVLAYGYPTGGTSLSITKGIVSRIEFVSYNYPVSGLRIQIDAAINPGNSGGPAIADDKMIGLAFAQLGNAQSIGYIIPNEEIELFLKDVADGRYDGKPAMFDTLQNLENPALRSFLKLGKEVEGSVVRQPSGDAPTILQQWDVLTRIGDTPIDDQGMVKIDSNLRVDFRYLVQKLANNGKVALTVSRAGATKKLELPVAPNRKMLVPSLNGDYPSYFIFGPLVLSKATAEYAQFLNNNATLMLGYSFIGSPLITRRGDTASDGKAELVVIASPFFPHALSKGYNNPSGGVVKSINGIEVRSLSHAVELLRDSTSDNIVIEPDNRGGETLVFPRKDMLAATEAILTDNGIRAQGSAELMKIWDAKAGK